MTTTPQQIKTTLAAALSSSLGTYIFSTGSPTPAIRIDDGSDPYPEQPTVTGLEVVIAPQIGTTLNSLQGNAFRETRLTDIILKQWDIEKTAIAYIPTVLSALVQLDSLIVEPNIARVIRSTQLDNIETARIRVSESLFFQV